METIPAPELLEKEKYETQYKCYFHLNKHITNELRKTLNELGKDYMDIGKIGMFKNDQIIIEILLTDGEHCSQIKMNKEDFRISHSIDDFVLDLDVNLLMMRIGGVRNSRALRSIAKEEMKFVLYNDDEFDMG